MSIRLCASRQRSLYSSRRENEMGGVCSARGKMRTAYSFFLFFGKPKGKIPLGRRRSRCEDNIKIDIRVIGCEGVAPGLVQWWALVNTKMAVFWVVAPCSLVVSDSSPC
jgi:hypothetical protein